MSLKDTRISAWEALPVTLANGTSLTETINLAGLRLFAITLPSAWSEANLTFQVSLDAGANWANMYDQNGNEVTASADTDRYIALDPTQFAPIQYLRIRSGTSDTAVPQGAARILQLVLREI